MMWLFWDAVKGWRPLRSKQSNSCVFTMLQQDHTVCSAAQTMIKNKSMCWDELAVLQKTGDFSAARQTFFSRQQIPSGEGHSDVNPRFLVSHWTLRRPPNVHWVGKSMCWSECGAVQTRKHTHSTWESVLIYTTMTSHQSNKNNMSQIFLWLGIMSWSHWGFCSHKGWF